MPASNTDAPNNPHGVSVGAAAASLAHVPTCPARLQRINGSVQAVLQQTPLVQKPVEHCDGVAQAPPWGTGVLVGVAVTVAVAVLVGVWVGVRVGVAVGVAVDVLVEVTVGVLVGVAVDVFVGVLVGVSVGVLVGARTHSPSLQTSPAGQQMLPHACAVGQQVESSAFTQVFPVLQH
jgi:hypothetical protein